MVSTGSPTAGFPGLFTHNTGLYRSRPANFLASFLVHVIGLVLVLWMAVWVPHGPPKLGLEIRHIIGPISFLSDEPGGHGGGGTHDKVAASRGALPKMTPDDQLTPPEAVPVNLDPKLPEPSSVSTAGAKRAFWSTRTISASGGRLITTTVVVISRDRADDESTAVTPTTYRPWPRNGI